jgi:hypothetical protein
MSGTKDQYQNMEGEISTREESYRLGETSVVSLLLTSLETISNDMLFQNIMYALEFIYLTNVKLYEVGRLWFLFPLHTIYIQGILYFPFLRLGPCVHLLMRFLK